MVRLQIVKKISTETAQKMRILWRRGEKSDPALLCFERSDVQLPKLLEICPIAYKYSIFAKNIERAEDPLSAAFAEKTIADRYP